MTEGALSEENDDAIDVHKHSVSHRFQHEESPTLPRTAASRSDARYLGGCIRTIGGAPLQIGGIADHVHILAALKPTHRLSDGLCDIKKGSPRWIREEMGCSTFHWQDGYAAFSVGRTELDRVLRYVANQAEHHAVKTFEDELRDLLKAYCIEFDERYLL